MNFTAMFYRIYLKGQVKVDLGSVGSKAYTIQKAFFKEKKYKIIDIKLGMKENVL